MKTIKIRNDNWPFDYVAAMVFSAKGGIKYKKTEWNKRDAIVTKDKRKATIFTGQKYDRRKYDLVKAFWDHDHCEICNWTFYKEKQNEIIEGYFNGYNWVCNECFDKILSNKEIMKELKKFKSKEKGL